MRIAIHQPQYLPWAGYLHKMANADLFVFLDDVQFKKNEWQHRNRVRGPRGWQWLSVPNHYRYPQRINDVPIGNEKDWRLQHLKTITACYGHAPFFSTYFSSFKSFFEERHETMATLNISSVSLCASLIGITTPVEISSRYRFPGASTERLVAICRHFGADCYLAGAGGRDYMDRVLFDKAGIEVRFQEFMPPVYPQHWALDSTEFIAGLSAVDLIFNCGPRSLGTLNGEP